MILYLEAMQYLGRAETGRSKPLQSICVDDNGIEETAFLKYRGFHDELLLDHLTGELVANLFARDLGLPAAQPAIVTVSSQFLDILPQDEEGDALRRAMRPTPARLFGSVQFEFARRWSKSDLVHASQRSHATQLYLFDTLVENTDRGNRNPNLLMHGNSFKVIDFGHCFQRCHSDATEYWGAKPWQPDGIKNYYPGDLQHIMWEPVKAAEPSEVDAFTDALVGLTDDKIEGYIDLVPMEWGEDTALRIVEYLIEARENASDFANRVREVLVR